MGSDIWEKWVEWKKKKTSAVNGIFSLSQCETASSVSERNTLPFDQQRQRGSFCSSLATVVPLPVPLRPWVMEGGGRRVIEGGGGEGYGVEGQGVGGEGGLGGWGGG